MMRKQHVAVGLTVLVLAASAITWSTVQATSAPKVIPVTEPSDMPAPTNPAARSRSTHQVLTLITGEKVALDRDAAKTETATLLTRASTATYLKINGDQYVVPDEAVPFLGTMLDPRLFDVSYLARAGQDDRHTDQLRFTSTATSVQQRLELVPAAKRVGGTSRHLTMALGKRSATQLGSLLRDAAKQGDGPRDLPEPIERFGRLAPSPTATVPLPMLPSARPASEVGTPYHTVTISFVDRDAKPGAAIGWLQNVSDGAQPLSFFYGLAGDGSRTIPTRGPVRFSVPDGTYDATFSVVTPAKGPDAIGPDPFDTTLVVHPQFDVTQDTHIVLDARTGVPYLPTIDTVPKAQIAGRIDALQLTRSAANGGGARIDGYTPAVLGLQASPKPDILLQNSRRLFFTPTPRVTVGGLGFSATTLIHTSDSTSGTPGPKYFLAFPHRGSIPSTTDFALRASQLTTLRSTYYAAPITGPTCSTPYVTSRPGLLEPWGEHHSYYDYVTTGTETGVGYGPRQDYLYSSEPQLAPWSIDVFDNCKSDESLPFFIRPGGTVNQTWGDTPPSSSAAAPARFSTLVIGGDPDLTSDAGASEPPAWQQTICPACRQGNLGMLYLQLSEHSGTEQYIPAFHLSTETLHAWRDNVPIIVDQPGLPAVPPDKLPLPMTTAPAQYTIEWTAGLDSPGDARQSTTKWTFRSAAADATTRPTAHELCAPNPALACSRLPMLFASVSAKSDYASMLHAGSSVPVTADVRPQAGAPAPDGVTATLSTSTDGQTWTIPRPLTGSGSRFTATLTVPTTTSSGFLSFRVVAHDRQGSTVTQTDINAYGVS